MDKAQAIVDAILADVTGRKGWSQEWDAFDEDIQEEIKDDWFTLVSDILKNA